MKMAATVQVEDLLETVVFVFTKPRSIRMYQLLTVTGFLRMEPTRR